ncbi:Zinc finger protein 383 [Galemys pyrenaicus]|uniref:Zinc finger protein 383 n=1 Tax=Galemys pyrenaicus TaxID=202257 RepID=A0A8J6AWL7_GALPY|nr:Zinc finger protein 383 [Galemys pyrenaicus]
MLGRELTRGLCSDLESMCETKLLSLKKEVYEIESCQREIMGLTKHGLEYSSFRDVLEYRSHFDGQLGYPNGHFGQQLFTHEYMPTFIQQTFLTPLDESGYVMSSRHSSVQGRGRGLHLGGVEAAEHCPEDPAPGSDVVDPQPPGLSGWSKKSPGEKRICIRWASVQDWEKSNMEFGLGFIKASNLLSLRKTHTGKTTFLYTDWGKRSSSTSILIKNQRTCPGEKRYVCKECGRGFTRKSNLITHQRTHPGEQPFVCRECGRGINDKSTLISHQQTHSGEKPFRCRDCGRRFSQKPNLFRHKMAHSGDMSL